MSKQMQPKSIDPGTQAPDPFHGAALVLPDGREIPITETMVQQALTRLEHQGQSMTSPATCH